jgi:hypothetical protein
MECPVDGTRKKMMAADAADAAPACPNCGADLLTVKLTATMEPQLYRKKRKRRLA